MGCQGMQVQRKTMQGVKEARLQREVQSLQKFVSEALQPAEISIILVANLLNSSLADVTGYLGFSYIKTKPRSNIAHYL